MQTLIPHGHTHSKQEEGDRGYINKRRTEDGETDGCVRQRYYIGIISLFISSGKERGKRKANVWELTSCYGPSAERMN